MVKFLALCIGVLAISGCTARAAYETVRVGERNHCNELPDTERERCLARTQDDFDAYQRKKAEAGQRQ